MIASRLRFRCLMLNPTSLIHYLARFRELPKNNPPSAKKTTIALGSGTPWEACVWMLTSSTKREELLLNPEKSNVGLS